MKYGEINTPLMVSHLEEAVAAINGIIRDAQAGKLNDMESESLSIDFAHALTHLCVAWHSKWLDNQSGVGKSSDDRYLMRYSVPQWHPDFQFVPNDEPAIFDTRIDSEGNY